MENLSGQVIKGYELGERLGAGGFGAVYKAHQSTVGREVAIKIILPHFASQPDFIRRFETEAQLVARLEHLHIIPLYDYWRDPTGAYLVMRWLRGGSLREALKNGPFAPEPAAHLLDQISSALAAAHRSSVIHRDLKPGNILLDEDGNAYLADFGIAKDVSVPNGITEIDAIVGSPDYLAPEQARSEPVTPQSDIYSLGVVLYELLTGQHPFPNLNSVERLYKHLNEPLPDITTLPDDLRNAVNAVIQKATAKNPANRYGDALEMAAAFREAIRLSGEVNVVETLTQREQDILRLIIEGRSNKEIAQQLFIALMTVKWYVTQIYRKLGVRSRVQAIVRARELNLIGGTLPDGAALAVGTVLSTGDFQPDNPYKGLRAFQAADHQDFFGREKVTEKLLKRLGENADYNRFLAVIGPSGSGKSSLVKAGLIPAIWRGTIPGSEKWFVVEMLPGARPIDELEIALTRVAANFAGNLNEHLRRDQYGLLRAAQLILPNDGSELLLAIDQFEEVFTLVEDENARQHFLNLLRAAVSDPHSRVRVVVTLRADFYDRPLQYPEFGDLIRNRMETVLPLSAQELERAITKPAERVGAAFEPGLVTSIVGDVNYQPGALPLLQYALTELFEQRKGRLLTQEAYQAIGRTTGALARRAEEIYLGLDDAGKEVARQMFLRLVTLGEGAEDTRRRVARSELLAIATPPPSPSPYVERGENTSPRDGSVGAVREPPLQADSDLMDEVIDAFSAYRLLSLDNDPGTRTPTVEVAHEAILREWERLRAWLNDSRDEIRLQRQLAHAADEWSAAGQESSFLLRGSRLETFQKWASETGLALTASERSFLEASLTQQTNEQAEEENRQARELKLAQDTAKAERRSASRLRYLVGVMAIFLVVAAGLSLLTLQSRNSAINSFNNSESQRLAAESANALQRGDSPELAALLAIRGLQAQYSSQADAALQKASRSYYGERVFDTQERLDTVAFSPDGRYGLTSGDTETKLWDLQTGVQLRSFAVNVWNLGSAAFSPDGLYILVGDANGTVHLWETATGVEAHTFSVASSPIDCLAVSPDGRYILTASDDGLVRLMDAATGALVRTFATNGAGALAFSPDSRRIVVSSGDTAQVWDVESGNQIWNVPISNTKTGAVFSPDGQYVLVTSFNKKAYLLDAATGQEIREFAGHTEGLFNGVFSPDGQYVLTGSLDYSARLWDTATGQEVRRFLGHTASVYSVAFSPDGRHILTGGKDNSARLWDIQSSPEQGTFSGAQGWMYGLAFSPDGHYVLTGTNDNTARLFDTATGTQLNVFTHPSAVQEVYFSPDSSMILTGDGDGMARLWDVATGEIVRTFADQGQITTAYSPDGRYILTSPGSGRSTLWDAASGAQLHSFDQGGYVAFSPDSQSVAITNGDTGSVYRYATATGTLLNSFPVPASPLVGVFSPDGKDIATGGRDNIVRLWDAASGQLVRQFVGHTNIIWTVAFSPDGRYILSGSQDKTARLWDAATGAQIRAFPSHNFSAISMAAYSPDGQSVLIGSSDGTAQLADVSEDRLIQSVCSRLLRDFTDQERTIYSIADQNPTCPNVAAQPAVIAPTWTPVLTPGGA